MTKAHKFPPILEKYPDDPINKLLLKDIWLETRYNDQAYFGSVIGKMGSGKSWWCLYLGLIFGYNEKMQREFSVERNVIFTIDDYLKAIRNPSYPGEPLIFEEAETTVNAQEHYKEEVIWFSKIISTQRSRNPISLFNLPAETQIAASMRRLRLGQFVFKKSYKQLGFSKFAYQELEYPMLASDYTHSKFVQRLKRENLNCRTYIDKAAGLKMKLKYNSLRFWKPKGEVWEKTLKEYNKKKDDYVDSLYDELIDKRNNNKYEVISKKDRPIEDIANEIELNRDVYCFPGSNTLDTMKIQGSFNIPLTKAQFVVREIRKKHNYLNREKDARKKSKEKEFDISDLDDKLNGYFDKYEK